MSSQRERQRERERNQRQLTTPSMGNNSNNSLFAEPIKQSIEDETTKRIKSTLGDFDSVKLLLINDNKPLLGISTREITRIKGHKAKIEQILSEMKNTLEPITALDDFSDETNAKYINNNNNYSDEHIVNNNEQQRNTQSFDRNNRRINSNNNDLSFDNTSGDEKLSNNHKPSNSKKRKSSKSDAENGPKRNGTKLTKSTSSSNSSESSSNSSSISSSSSESSDDEEKESDNISSKQEEIPNSRQETPKTSQAPQTEIAVWDLETFMDKKTTTTTNTSTTVSSNTITTIKSSSYDNIADTIDRVAKGELGDNMSSSSGSPSPTPKKRRKSTQNSESIRNEHSKQNSSSNQSQYKSSKHNQNSPPIQDFVFEPHIKEIKSDQQKPLLTPKSLIVSIKLMLLKRIPGQNYSNICKTISSNSSNRSNSSISVDNSIANDDNNSNFAKSKLTQNIKTENRSIKTENANKSRDSNNKLNNSSMSKPSKQQLKDNDSRNSEHTSSSFRDNTSLSNSSTIKEEPHSPLALPPLTSAITIPPPPTTIAANITPTLMRTPPEISPSVGQPDDFLSAAKRIKHAADRETDRTVQACKYLEAVLYFILTGNAMELSGNEIEKVCVMYKETLNLIRQITNKFAKSRSSHSADIPTTDHKLTTLSYRCQSLLYLKLSRLKSKEIRDNNKSIQQQSLEINNNSNTNSTTIPTSLLNVFQRQLLLLQQYHTAHDLWQQADHLIEKHASCKAFFVALDNVAGCLSLNSTFDHLVHYVRTGLQILK